MVLWQALSQCIRATLQHRAVAAANALRDIAQGPDALKRTTISAGAVTLLVALIKSDVADRIEAAAAALGNFAADAKQAIACAGTMAEMIVLLESDEGRRAEHAARTLLHISSRKAGPKQAVADGGALDMLVRMLGGQQRDRAELASGQYFVHFQVAARHGDGCRHHWSSHPDAGKRDHSGRVQRRPRALRNRSLLCQHAPGTG